MKAEIKLRVVFADRGMIGPGKADLLENIRATGSISAAGRKMGMSYKRAWSLVETLNAMFREPLVESSRGGAQGGGAALTPLGDAVLAEYRDLQTRAGSAISGNVETLESLLSDISDKT